MRIMYNLNVSGAGGAASNLLSLPQGESSCTTPRTPEILNSLIAMTNPFDSYRANSAPRLASSPPGGSDTTSTSSSGSPSCMSPPSVQHTCSQLIKEGLKLTIQTKRRQTGRCATTNASQEEDVSKMAKKDELTPEDEERRRRRRERNKIAATKCRLKKRERTVNLVQESEILENQNHDLKSQIQELETQRRRLVDMLSVHRPSCTKHRFTNLDNSAFPSNASNFHRDIRCTSAVTMETNTTMYRRVNVAASNFPRPPSTSSVDTAVSYRRIELSESSSYQRPASTTGIEPSYQRMEPVETNTTYCRPPSGPGLESTTNTYHNFDEDVIKDPTVMLPYCRTPSGGGMENSPQFMRINSDLYNCQPELTNLDNSMAYMKSENSPSYQRSSSSFGRPLSLDINTPVSPDYDSNVEVLDSPNVAPNNYQHFEEDQEHNYSAGFASANMDRGCIA